MDVPVRIRHWRLDAGLTKKALAERVGVGQSSATGWERSVRPQTPSLPTLARICAACGITLEEFWGPLITKRRGADAVAP